ncbi:MAG: reprolysin-like metallopeptidase, partial [Bacteroidota bacterium]
MRTLLLFALMAPITAFAQADFLQPASMTRTALSAEQASTLDVLAAEPTVASQTLVYVDTAVLRSAANMRSRVPGFLDAAYALDRIEERTAGDYSWFGTGADELRTTAVLVVRGDRVTGTLRTPEGLFSLRALGGGLHTLLRIDEGAFPPDHGEDYASIVEHSDHAHADHDPEGTPHVHRSAPATSERRDAAGALTSRSVAPTLGVVVGYTPSAKNQVGGTANIEAIAQLAVDETNAAFAASGILARLSLNHVYETADDNSTSFSQDLNDFTFEGGSNPKFDGIEALRDTYDGDFAVLLRASGGSCGVAWLTASVSRAFSVTAQNCATGNYTFGHEIGHNIGMRHNKEEDPNLAPYAYAHGLLNVADDWRTILSYNSGSCPGGFCSRLQRFSTPSETFGGVALGDETRSNNARVLNQRAD